VACFLALINFYACGDPTSIRVLYAIIPDIRKVFIKYINMYVINISAVMVAVLHVTNAVGYTYNNVTAVPTDIPDDATTISVVNSPSLLVLRNGELDHLTQVIVLRIDNNANLEMIEEAVFDELEQLDRLHLHNNNIMALALGIFDKLSNVYYLTVSHNNIQTLPNGVFDQTRQLTQLSLHSNQIKSLPEGIFDQLAKLKTLKLRNNNLVTLPQGIFEKLSLLEDLELSANLFTSVPPLCQMEEMTGLYMTLYNNPNLDMCLCRHAWLKQAQEDGATVQIDDKPCKPGGEMWSAMSLSLLLQQCTPHSQGES
jgi:hypothetical protein